LDTAKTTGRDLNRAVVACLNFTFSIADKVGSQSEKEFLWDNYADIANEFCELLTKPPFSNSHVRCAFVKAHIFYQKNGIDPSFLKTAAALLQSGEYSNAIEKNMWKAREAIFAVDRRKNGGRRASSSGSGIREIYLIVATGIEMFKQQDISERKLKKLTKDPFPLW
jgi:hypothetical protein